MNIGVILAAGMSQRFQSLVHKQYLKVNGKELLSYSIEKMQKCDDIDKIILVIDKDEFETHYIENKYNIECVCGGAKRNESVKNALEYIKNNYDCNIVIFHDAVRPFVDSNFFSKAIKMLEGYDCVLSYQTIVDSLYSDSLNFVNRDEYKLIQTPEIMYFNQLYDVFDENFKNKVIAAQLKNPKINFIKSDEFGFKVTYPKDLFLAEYLDKICYYKDDYKLDYDNKINNKKVLLFGGSGGLGSEIIKRFSEFENIEIKAPSSKELNLNNISVQDIQNYCNDFIPDIVINSAALSCNDDDGIIETFDKIMSVNLKSNLVIMEYLKTLNSECKFITISSSSSTKGRQNITNYSASKCALNSVIESNAEKFFKQQIYINAVIPEKINTPMIQKIHRINISQRELLDTGKVVDAILFLINSNCYGKLLHVRKGL